MKITHLSAECLPFAKTGGLGDVVAALPTALAAQGHETDIWIPFHLSAAEWYRQRQSWPEAAVEPFVVSILGQSYTVGILRGTLPGSTVPIYFVAHDPLFHRPAGIYAPSPLGLDDGLWRFALFVRAAIEAMRRLGHKPEILHVHDWHPALATMLAAWSSWRDRWFDDIANVVTIHNVAYQGVYDPALFPALGLPPETWSAAGLEHGGALNLLKGALMAADVITTVSPTYAWEIQTLEGGYGLDGVLRLRADRLEGILNGIDVREWDPSQDPYLPARYDAQDLSGKRTCRRTLCDVAGMDPNDPGLVLGAIGRLTYQKGFDVLFEAVPSLIAAGVRMIMLGAGEPGLEATMASYERAFPGRFKAWKGYSEPRAHLIEAGADAFIMPSRFEPCGLNQMYSLRYGTLPVVRRTGGLADTVVGFTGGNAASATGFTFDDLTPGAIAGTLSWVQTVFDRPEWHTLVANAMRQDFSWARSAARYEEVYRRARFVRGL